jgi:hypothetical protein
MYDVTAIQFLLFCRLASQSGRFDFQPAKVQSNSTAMTRRQGRTFLSKQSSNKATRCLLKVSSKIS